MQTLQQRKAKFFLLLPVIVIPLMTFLFWKFGGGQAQAAASRPKGGYNFQLPEAQSQNQDHWTMLDYYKKADQDSAKKNAFSKKDPAYFINTGEQPAPEKKVYQKLKDLEEQLAEKESDVREPRVRKERNKTKNYAPQNQDVAKLEHLLEQMKQPVDSDPEMEQLNEMLNKLVNLDKTATNESVSSADSVNLFALPVLVEDDNHSITASGQYFFGLLPDNIKSENNQRIIKAIIEEDQRIVNGSLVALTLQHPVKIGSVIIPERHRVFATASIQQNRLQLAIKGIVFEHQLLPVQLMAVDQTGLPGLVINHATARDFTQQTAQRSIGSIGFNSINPTIEGQIAEAGLQTAKGLFTKKTKMITVALNGGDELWLVDQTSQK